MAIKTFNIEQEVYDKFSTMCKENGISMSKQVQFFMQSMVEEEPRLRKEYVEKLEHLRRGKFVKVDDFAKRFGVE